MELYSYQKEAKEIIDKTEDNLILEAPTGAGKTLVGEFAILKALSNKKKVIYTTPLKALSNQKYKDFKKTYKDVGLVTGDFTIDRESSVLVMTAEILKNICLTDKDFLNEVSHIVLDEFHYMNDSARGTVWEEIIMYTPKHCSFICLSATFPNSDDIRTWMARVHKETKLLNSIERPVPLEYFYYNNSNIKPLKNKLSKVTEEFNINSFLAELKKKDMLPCIYFLFNRLKCNELATDVEESLLTPEEVTLVSDEITSFIYKYPFFAKSFLVNTLKKGVGVHHSGILPQVKVFIEQLYLKGLVKIIFSTETLSAGINLPARTTILSKFKKYSEEGLRYLTISEFKQMSGRAGRKGYDDIGHVIIKGDDSYEYSFIKSYIEATPEKVTSKIRLNYNTICTFISNTSLEYLHSFMENSFLSFLSSKKERFCPKYTDRQFKLFVAYSNKLMSLKEKLKNSIITKKEYSKKISKIKSKLKPYSCNKCPEISNHLQHLVSSKKLSLDKKVTKHIDSKVDILKRYKYIDRNNNLTWLGDVLRLINSENELFTTELFLSGILDQLDYRKLTCLLASVLTETKERDIKQDNKNKVNIREVLKRTRVLIDEITYIEKQRDIKNYLDIDKSFVNLIDNWVCGESWSGLYLKGLTTDYEGDFYKLIKKVIDILKQYNYIIENDPYICSENLKTSIDNAIVYLNRDIIREM